MSPISFFVNGEPKGQPRPRAFARRMGNKFVARVYDAGTAEGWKSLIALEAKRNTPTTPLAGPVHLSLTFNFPRPKHHFTAGDQSRGLKAGAPIYHTSKPDNDNLQKAVMDALTQIGGFWNDDCQVASVDSVKLYAGRSPGVMIEIEAISGSEAAA